MNLKDKILSRMFKEVNDVVIDITTNTIGVKINNSIYSVSKDGDDEYELVENIFGDMSVSIPAFAQSTLLENVKEGDLVLSSDGSALGWVTKKTPKTLKVIKVDGHLTTVSPAKSNILSQGPSVMVVSSMMGDNLKDSLPMIMAMSDDTSSLKELIPMLMMSQQSDMNPMMMAMMMGDGDNDMIKMMILSQAMGQQSMNPMLMAALLK